jgi:hypothetical protein
MGLQRERVKKSYPTELASRRRALVNMLITLGGLIGTFAVVFKPSTGVATFFSAFVISLVTIYATLLFPEITTTRYGKFWFHIASL